MTNEELVSLSDRFLTVSNQRFHYVWLRDHCLCSQCQHTSSFQKIYDISDQPQCPRPNSATIQDKKLVIEWNEDPPHRSIFPFFWLLNYAYDRNQYWLMGIASHKIFESATPTTFGFYPRPQSHFDNFINSGVILSPKQLPFSSSIKQAK